MVKKPDIGSMVYWYLGGDRNAQPYPALVVRHSMGTVDLHIIAPDLRTFLVRTGVPHCSDTTRNLEDLRECGVWDYPPSAKQPTPEKGKAASGDKGDS